MGILMTLIMVMQHENSDQAFRLVASQIFFMNEGTRIESAVSVPPLQGRRSDKYNHSVKKKQQKKTSVTTTTKPVEP